MPRLTYAEAAREAIAEEMRRDANVWAVGEDLGRGGVFGQYKGLVEEFGPERIADAPISEACIMGAAVGAAMMGTRPIVELRFSDFALCAWTSWSTRRPRPASCSAARAACRWSCASDRHVAFLGCAAFRVAGGLVHAHSGPRGRHAGDAADNTGLLKAAIRCDDPVVYLEHKNLWPLEGDVPEGEHLVEIGKARIARAGKDLTIVSWSAAVHVSMAAAQALARDGIEAEVIDLRSLWPWDKATVLESVAKTGRLLVAHEAVRVGGFGAEIAAAVGARAREAQGSGPASRRAARPSAMRPTSRTRCA